MLPTALGCRRLLLGVLLALVGCTAEPSFDERMRACADLSGARSSPNAELRTRIATLEQQKGTPAQLQPSGFRPPADDNAAAQLADLFSDTFRKQIGERLAQLVESGQPPTSLLSTHSVTLRKLGVIAELPLCRFATDPAAGYFAPMRYLDDVALAARFELLNARQASIDNDPAKALGAIRRGLRWCRWLGRVPRVSARILAATLRRELLGEVGEQLATRLYGRYEAEQLYASLRDDLAQWPSDRRMLNGDRAMVAHAYEAIRAGLLDRMITIEERKSLRAAGVYDRLLQPQAAEIDHDQTNYLTALEVLIAAAESPLHERTDALEQAAAIVTAAPNLASGRLFTPELLDAQRIAARDRARCEAWCVALAGAADLVTPPFRMCPTNGLPYEAAIDGVRIVVRTGDPLLEDVQCPRL